MPTALQTAADNAPRRHAPRGRLKNTAKDLGTRSPWQGGVPNRRSPIGNAASTQEPTEIERTRHPTGGCFSEVGGVPLLSKMF
jgi:hypothetical protein